MKTFNRGTLLKLVKAGRVVATSAYSFDDQYGAERGLPHEMPVEINPGDFKLRREGVVYLWESDFTSKSGRAHFHGDSTDRVHLRIHSNLNYDFRILPVVPAENPAPAKTPVELDYEAGKWVPSYYGVKFTVAKKRAGTEREADLTFIRPTLDEAIAEADRRNETERPSVSTLRSATLEKIEDMRGWFARAALLGVFPRLWDAIKREIGRPDGGFTEDDALRGIATLNAGAIKSLIE